MFFDVVFTVDENGQLTALQWGSDDAQKMYEGLFENWITNHRNVFEVFPIKKTVSRDVMAWDGENVEYSMFPISDGKFYLFLHWQDNRVHLFERALDRINEGIQIYDRNACAVYFNRTSRTISHISGDVDTTGRHLLDLYNLDEKVSTTMTALRTQAPVINRVDRFLVGDNTTIATANTAYPIIKEGELLGAVVFEQTADTVRINMEKMGIVGKALASASYEQVPISFSGYTFENMIGDSEKIKSVVRIAKKVAPQDSSVFIVGETGTGKEIIAQSIHNASPRGLKKFLAINCAALPETMIESILFGTEKGTYTGSRNKAGYLEEARGGTLFLDGINYMSLAMQSKILRVIQEKTFRRVGGAKDIGLDVRIISSFSEDPFKAIAENKLRKDLFYRLSTVMIEMPALRDHKEDIRILAQWHLNTTAYQYVNAIKEISQDVYVVLEDYGWPGNVRELFHVLDYAQNVADSTVMKTEHLPSYLQKKTSDTTSMRMEVSEIKRAEEGTLQELMDEYENQVIRKTLEQCGYNVTIAAKKLGILRQSLQYRIRKYGIMF